MFFLYKLFAVISLVLINFTVYGAIETKEDTDSVDHLIQRIQPFIPSVAEFNIPKIIEETLSESITQIYGGDIRRAGSDLNIEILYTQAWEGKATPYQELKDYADRNYPINPIAQGFFARFLLSMGKAYFFVEDLDPKTDSFKPLEDYVNSCAPELLDLAERNHPYALEILGYFYSVGCGRIIQDYVTAGSFAKRAADLGLPRAQDLMGCLYKTMKQEELAISWFLCAMQNGFAAAFYNMTLPFTAFNLPEDLITALLEQATQGNYHWAKYVRGQRYQNARKYREAFRHFHDLAQSHYILGYYGIWALSAAQTLSYQEARQLWQYGERLYSDFGYTTQRERDFAFINALTTLLHQFTASYSATTLC